MITVIENEPLCNIASHVDMIILTLVYLLLCTVQLSLSFFVTTYKKVWSIAMEEADPKNTSRQWQSSMESLVERSTFFLHEDGVYLNHGSFGTVPRVPCFPLTRSCLLR